jgi:transcriptional regulator with XRE-family HTH domain
VIHIFDHIDANRWAMPRTSRKDNNFARALARTRLATGRIQEDFLPVSSQQTISKLENGHAQPTLAKVDDLASVMGVHPASLIALAYFDLKDPTSVRALMEPVLRELEVLAEVIGRQRRAARKSG